MDVILKMVLDDEKKGIYPGFKSKNDIFTYFENLDIDNDNIYYNTTALHRINEGEKIYFLFEKIIMARATYVEQEKYETEEGDGFTNGIKISDIEIFYNITTELKAGKQPPVYIDKKIQKEIDKILLNTDTDLYLSPEEIIDSKNNIYEGAKKKIYVNSYERNPIARKECLAKYGYRCQICNFNFEEIYGEIGKEFIHVHHIKPLHEINEKYKVNPIKDLIPICPNCHAMLHRKRKNPISIEELKKLIK